MQTSRPLGCCSNNLPSACACANKNHLVTFRRYESCKWIRVKNWVSSLCPLTNLPRATASVDCTSGIFQYACSIWEYLPQTRTETHEAPGIRCRSTFCRCPHWTAFHTRPSGRSDLEHRQSFTIKRFRNGLQSFALERQSNLLVAWRYTRASCRKWDTTWGQEFYRWLPSIRGAPCISSAGDTAGRAPSQSR